jgi:prefoldin subunit 5
MTQIGSTLNHYQQLLAAKEADNAALRARIAQLEASSAPLQARVQELEAQTQQQQAQITHLTNAQEQVSPAVNIDSQPHEEPPRPASAPPASPPLKPSQPARSTSAPPSLTDDVLTPQEQTAWALANAVDGELDIQDGLINKLERALDHNDGLMMALEAQYYVNQHQADQLKAAQQKIAELEAIIKKQKQCEQEQAARHIQSCQSMIELLQQSDTDSNH